MLHQHGISFLKRYPPERLVANGKNKPGLKKDQIRLLIVEAKKDKTSQVFSKKNINVNSPRDCYGHLVAELGYRLVCYLMNKVNSSPGIAKQHSNTVAIDKFISKLREGDFSQINKHYSSQFSLVS